MDATRDRVLAALGPAAYERGATAGAAVALQDLVAEVRDRVRAAQAVAAAVD